MWTGFTLSLVKKIERILREEFNVAGCAFIEPSRL